MSGPDEPPPTNSWPAGDTAGDRAIRAAEAAAEPAGDFDPIDAELCREPRSDYGNARRLIARYGRDLISIGGTAWLVWDGRRWQATDGDAAAKQFAHQVGRAIPAEARALEAVGQHDDETEKEYADRIKKHRNWAVSCGDTGRVNGMLTQAAAYLRRRPEELDADPWLLTVANGTLALGPPRTGPGTDEGGAGPPEPRLGPHDRRHLITRLAPVEYDPEAQCPEWRAFLSQVQPEDETQAFLQRLAGYGMTGDISEQVMVVLFGVGANGKSTFLDGLRLIQADYAATVPVDTVLHQDRRSGGGPTPELARLTGARLVVASEPDVSARLGESVIKSVTGGEPLLVRHLHQEPFEFEPTFKLILSCNHKPAVRGQDEGIWRRVLIVPFPVMIPPHQRRPQRELMARFEGEKSGILNWMLDGYRLWRERGLDPPPGVRAATDEYRADNDSVGDFLRGCVVARAGARIKAGDLYRAYQYWAGQAAASAVSQTVFGKRLAERGYRKDRKSGGFLYHEIELNQAAEALAGYWSQGSMV